MKKGANIRDGAGEGGFGASVLGPEETVHLGLLTLKFRVSGEELTFSQAKLRYVKKLKFRISLMPKEGCGGEGRQSNPPT